VRNDVETQFDCFFFPQGHTRCPVHHHEPILPGRVTFMGISHKDREAAGSGLTKSLSLSGDLRRIWFPRYGPRVCGRLTVNIQIGTGLDRPSCQEAPIDLTTRRHDVKSPPKRSRFKWRSCIWEEDLSLSTSGTEPWWSTRDWRFGLAERIESIWDRVGRGDSSMASLDVCELEGGQRCDP
jgi:hypothetical protein